MQTRISYPRVMQYSIPFRMRVVMSKNGLIFFLGPPRTGGYAYYPVPSAPIEDLRPIGKI